MRPNLPRSLPPVAAALAALTVHASAAARPAGVPTPLDDPGHTGLAHYFQALSATAHGGVARAVHYGDSTIAADGIARTVRARLTTRFGDAGPGFVTAAFDPSANERTDVVSRRAGDWALRTILFGGADGRYGLGGIVGIARTGASVTLHGVGVAGGDDAPAVPMKHLEVWYQAGAGYGTFWAKTDGVEVARAAAVAEATEDRRFVLEVPAGFRELSVGATGGPVPYYGVVLETGNPGTTWEALGVIGVGSRSFTTYAKEHLPEQTAARRPDLIVVQLGGNEAGFPTLQAAGGAGYVPIYQGALDAIRAGAPEASCLVVTPLDQGFLDETGVPQSRPGMPNLVARQRDVAHASGCAFWSAWDAMGGKGSALRWGATPGLGTGDYVHVTARAQAILGDLLADAILADYDAWSAGG